MFLFMIQLQRVLARVINNNVVEKNNYNKSDSVMKSFVNPFS